MKRKNNIIETANYINSYFKRKIFSTGTPDILVIESRCRSFLLIDFLISMDGEKSKYSSTDEHILTYYTYFDKLRIINFIEQENILEETTC